MILAVLAGVGLASVSAAPGAELKASDIVNRKGDGRDGKGNTADDTWQFWWEEVVHRNYHRFNSFYKHKKYDGWSHNHDMDTTFEGVWANKKTGQMFAHPYCEKNAHRAAAVTYKAPKTGRYDISGGVTDVKVVKHRLHKGILWRVEIATGGAKGKVVGAGGPIGDKVGPDSAKFSIRNVRVRKGQFVRLVIDPNKWWGTDMTRIDSFRIVPAAAKPATKPAATKPAATQPAVISGTPLISGTPYLIIDVRGWLGRVSAWRDWRESWFRACRTISRSVGTAACRRSSATTTIESISPCWSDGVAGSATESGRTA